MMEECVSLTLNIILKHIVSSPWFNTAFVLYISGVRDVLARLTGKFDVHLALICRLKCTLYVDRFLNIAVHVFTHDFIRLTNFYSQHIFVPFSYSVS